MPRFIQKYWRQTLFICVLLTAWLAFLFTTMPGDAFPVRYLKAMYFAATLFIFGALDIGFPHGGPVTAIVILWICYFIAPAFTISYAYTIIEERLLNRPPFRLRKHTVILGMGRTGMFLHDVIRQYSSHEKIVIVDRDPDNQNLSVCGRYRMTWRIKGDFEDADTLRAAKVQKARRVFISTNNDLANLKAAFMCLKMNPDIETIYCHLQNYTMHEDFSVSLKSLNGYEKIAIFNGYASAAQKILKMINIRDEEEPDKDNIFIFLGFGHFAQTLFDDLVMDSILSPNDEILVVTLRTNLMLDSLAFPWGNHEINSKCIVHPPIYRDLYSAGLWDDINDLAEGMGKQMIIINCLDDDEANISLAVQIKRNGPEAMRKALIFCRTFKPVSPELKDILETSLTPSDNRDVIPFSIKKALFEAYSEMLRI